MKNIGLVLLFATLAVGCGPKIDPVEHRTYGKLVHTDELYVNDFYDCLVDLAPTPNDRAEIQAEREEVSLKFLALVNSVEFANITGVRTEDVDTVNACLTDKGWTQYRNQ